MLARVTLIVLLLCAPIIVHAAALKHHSFTLENGLRVVVVPLGRSGAVSHNLLISAGGADDAVGASGVAHYLEHLLFNGTPTVPEGEYSKRIERMGGQYNAFTSADMTGYYVTIAAKHLEEVMALESDRMQHSAPPQSAYGKERQVVLEERRSRTDKNPAALLREAMNAAMFRHHPYRIPIIGWAHEIEQLGEVSARAFLARHYVPSNAVLLLVGDVTANDAKVLAKKHYGDWQGAPKAPRRWLSEPPRQVSQTITLAHEQVQVPRLSRAYVAPSLGTAINPNEVLPLMIAEALLGDDRTGWLYRELVEKQALATHVSVYYNPFSRGPSQFRVSLTPAKGVAFDRLEAAYEQAVAGFIATDIPAKDIERVRNRLKAETIFAQDSVQGLAFTLGQLIMLGYEPDWFNRWGEFVDALTEEQVHAALADTLTHNTAITGYLLPEKAEVTP